jgi:ribonuclease P protein component
MSVKTASKTDRLKRRSDFLRLRDAGKKWVSATVIVQAGTGETPGIRYGLTATKKLGNAVIRNRIKRRLREAVRRVLKDKTSSADIVLIGRVETATCDFQTLVKDLGWCLRKLEIV